MINSMTGYGKGEQAVDGGSVKVELRTVNHRYLEFTTRLPRALYGKEKEVERAVRAKIKRGHVYLSVTLDKRLESEGVEVNYDMIRRVYWALSRFVGREGIPGGVSMDTLLMLPDVVTVNSDSISVSKIWPATRKALSKALDRCVEMRAAEGAELEKHIAKQIHQIERVAKKIEKRTPAATKRAFAKAQKRIRQLVGDRKLDESRLVTEAAVMADRIDYSEEIVRLNSHIKQFVSILAKGGETSKKLTFLLQEIHRETTTMGNKSAEAGIIRECITIKECVEKAREQVQNIE
jgi:uncharacterized protein (TIGR00255 family)